VFLFEKKFFCILKNLSKNLSALSEMDRFFPFVANELKFVVLKEYLNLTSPCSFDFSIMISSSELLITCNSDSDEWIRAFSMGMDR
jgi:hypothetical protein